MKKMLLLVLVLAVIFAVSSVSYADKWDEYNAKCKIPLVAGILAYVPSLGHAYAGDWGRGMPFLIADGVGLAAIIAGNKDGKIDPTMGTAGAVTIGIAEIWGMIDAYNTAEEYNKKLRVELGLEK